jgi:hypothetical protein
MSMSQEKWLASVRHEVGHQLLTTVSCTFSCSPAMASDSSGSEKSIHITPTPKRHLAYSMQQRLTFELSEGAVVSRTRLLLILQYTKHFDLLREFAHFQKMNEEFQYLHSPVVRNNHAILLMQEAKYDNAVNLLSSTLSSLSAFLRVHHVDADESSLPLDLCTSGARFLSCPAIAPSSGIRIESVSNHFVECPLEIPRDLSLTSQTGEVLSCVVIYNLALAWHMWGYKTSHTKEKNLFLSKALNLYRLAHGIMCNGRMRAYPSHYMALVNNTGHAHFCLGNTEKANACFQLLLETLMCVVDQGSQCTCEFLDKFVSNVATLILEDKSAPAA